MNLIMKFYQASKWLEVFFPCHKKEKKMFFLLTVLDTVMNDYRGLLCKNHFKIKSHDNKMASCMFVICYSKGYDL